MTTPEQQGMAKPKACGRSLATGQPCPDHPLATPDPERPPRFTGTPLEWDAYLREVMADDTRLRFYQWIGAEAVREAVRQQRDAADLATETNNPRDLDEYFNDIDPDLLGGPFPVLLPLGLRFCDVHTHTHGGSRLPSCRLD